MPDLFTEDVLEELASAERCMSDARAAAADAMRTGSTLFTSLGVAESLGKDAIDGTVSHSNVLLSAEGQVEAFQAMLATLMSNQLDDEEMVRDIGVRMRQVSQAIPGLGLSGQNDGNQVESKKSLLPPDLLLKVFAFLPIEDIIDRTEHVCTTWNKATTSSFEAQAFWIGCAHREFPAEVAALIAAEGAALLDADWRTVAVMAAASVDMGEDEDACDAETEEDE